MRSTFFALALSACIAATPVFANTVPMQDFDHRPLKHYTGRTLTPEEIEKAIVAGAVRLGWQLTSREADKLGFRLELRSHKVDIEILIDGAEYAVRHVHSENMDWVPKGTEIVRYGERVVSEKDQIHPSYNRWINNLIRNIDGEIQRS